MNGGEWPAYECRSVKLTLECHKAAKWEPTAVMLQTQVESCQREMTPNMFLLEHLGFSSSCAITSAIAIRSASRGSEETLALSSLMVFTICSAFCSVVGRNTGTGTWKNQKKPQRQRGSFLWGKAIMYFSLCIFRTFTCLSNKINI